MERAFGTLQDRLVKELRLAGISSIEAANAWLPGFIATHNARFGREPANAKDLHRPLTAADDLDEILAWREQRTVTHNLTLHYDRMMLILEPTPFARSLVRKKIEVVNYPDGRFVIQFEGKTLHFRAFDKIRTVEPGTIVDNKRLSAVLAMVKAQQVRTSQTANAGMSAGNVHRTIWRRRGCHRKVGCPELPWPRQSPDRFRLIARGDLRGCWARATASRAALRAPACRLRPLTPPPAPSEGQWCRFAQVRPPPQ